MSFGEVEVPPQAPTWLAHGEVMVLPAGQSYRIADRAEVHANASRSPPAGPPETFPAEKNRRLHFGDGCFLFEDRPEPGDSPARHSHAARAALVLGVTRPWQWPTGPTRSSRRRSPAPSSETPGHPPGKNIGAAPPRNLDLEFIPWGIP